jgi:hypothetical protein
MRACSFGAVHESGSDPGCVKTSTRGECAELSSLFSSFDDACQSGSLLIQRNRDKSSTRKFEVGVFTQPRPKAEVTPSDELLLVMSQNIGVAKHIFH